MLAAASTMPMSGLVAIFLGEACFLWLLSFVDKLIHFYCIQFVF